MNLKYLKDDLNKGKIPVAAPPKNIVDYKVSTGSLKFDLVTGGGLGPGIIRLWGAFEGGKTSCALEIANNFLDVHKEKGRVLFIKAEMRLSYKMEARSRRPFIVMKPKEELEALQEWSHENIFVYTQNKYPEICNFIISTLKCAKDDDTRVLFIVDSLDWAVMPGDFEGFIDPKSGDQPARVAKHTKEFLRHATPMMTEGGHMGIYISQVSSNIKINKYTGAEQKEVTAVGGNGLLHAADWIFQFKPKTSGAEIKELSGAADFDTNDILGTYAKLKIIKSVNETTGFTFEYPIKRGSGIWTEFELTNILTSLGIASKSGGWYSFPEKTVEAIKKKLGIDFPQKINGDKKLMTFFEENPQVVDFLSKGVRKALKQEKISKDEVQDAMLEPDEEVEVLPEETEER